MTQMKREISIVMPKPPLTMSHTERLGHKRATLLTQDHLRPLRADRDHFHRHAHQLFNPLYVLLCC